ncbi:MAG: NAD(P)-dependent oxidoreductase [Clostridia bacterium]|jgi:3-hydroxyisobutyrate dehydrogenase-like beta-hydroxyacid dehydrogenase|nr:NAD(P)-dependent oxidoreductase [Clostridia bacterium]NLS85306.1 NAD(P)-dependent oxidoreductase [Oscillospiraceae bacterium]
MKTIGFIGTGVMGASMVRNLLGAGFEVSVYNRTKEKALPLVDDGAKLCETVAECAADKDVIITMVGYPADVEETWLGEGGVLKSAKSGAYCIDMTTSAPSLAQKLYKEAKKLGIHAIDAPVSGGDSGAKNGTLAIMAGGDEADISACMPVFEAMGKNIVYEGAAGAGQHTKMCNQIALAGALAGACEALTYAHTMGLDAEKMMKTISSGAAGSWQLSNVAPKMQARDFAPSFYLKHFIKDMGIAIEEAENNDLTLEILSDVNNICETLEAEGCGDEGTSAIIKYYEN